MKKKYKRKLQTEKEYKSPNKKGNKSPDRIGI